MRAWLHLTVATALATMGGLNASAQTAPPPPPPPPSATAPDAYFQHATVLQVKLSPGGKRLAIKTSLGGDRVTVGVLDIEGGGQLYRPASFTDADVYEFDWADDERLVFSAIDLRSVGSDMHRYAPGLFSVTFDGKKPRKLVNRGSNFITDGKDEALAYNHMLLTVPKPQPGVEPGTVLVGQLGFSDKGISSVTPLWLNVRTGGWIWAEVGKGAPREVLHWWFDSAGNARVAYTRNKDRAAYHWRGPGDTTWHQIAEGDALSMPFHVVSVDDAGHLYVVQASGPGATEVLTRFNFKTGAPEDTPMVAVPGFDFLGHLLNDKPGASSLGVRVDADGEATVWFDPAMKAVQQEIDTRLPGRVNRIDCRRCGQPDMVALVESYSDRDPGVLFLYDAATKKLKFLLKVRNGIDPKTQGSLDFQRIKARDGRDLPLWITQPRNLEPGKPVPAVVLVHGGPWVRGGHWQWDSDAQFLAAQGYLVIEPEFRGSEGYGDEHLRAGFKQWGQTMEDDLADALLWAQKQGLAKPGKACIAGASYGGYAALMGPVRYPELFRCVVAWVGVADLNLFLEGSFWTQDDISDAGRKYGLPQRVGDIKADAAMLAANNPVLLASKMKAPVLLAYGESDERVPVAHGKRMREALIKAGNPPEWITYPFEAHGWYNPDNRIDFAKRMAAFLAKNLN
ncbi:alpha/beta hydrolase family protein [Burkholderiaceae bacterium UC74_6]